MSKPLLSALLALSLLSGCHGAQQSSIPGAAIELERIPSSEISLVATWASDARVGATIAITLVNVGQRTLRFDTGLRSYPMADFAFSLELPTHEWLSLNCQICVPGSMAQPIPYTIELKPAQFLRFTLPLSTLVAMDPHSGTAINLCSLEGQILVELQVPTLPNAKYKWPGYVIVRLPLRPHTC